MQRRRNLAPLILASVVALVLTLLIVAVGAQAQIAFVSNRDGNWQIYVMDINGRNQQRLTSNAHNDLSPSWSPDGERIAFESWRHGPDEIYVMDIDGNNPQRLTNNGHDDRSPSWSPDGKRIAFSSNSDEHAHVIQDWFTSEIYVMDADGNNPQRLTNNGHDDYSPSWSPDGKRIIFSSEMAEHFRGGQTTHEIYVIDADGGNQQRLTENLFDDWDPVWSPDGKRIAFASDRQGDFGNFEIYVMDADGGNQRNLTNHPNGDWDPAWSPDGKWITFISERDGNSEIYVMDANGGNQRNLTKHGGHDRAPAWYTPALAVAPGGKTLTTWGWLKQVDR